MEGAARDFMTARDGTGTTISSAALTAEVDERWHLTGLDVLPGRRGAELVGAFLRSGFRAAAADAFPTEVGTPLGLLLDDLPVAALIGGYAALRTTALTGGQRDVVGPGAETHMADVCSGWRRGGTMLTSVAGGRGIPLQDCPPAPPRGLEDDDGWHDLPPLPVASMRRYRRIDVVVRDSLTVDAMFRDVYGEPDGTESVLHEYSVSAEVDPETGILLEILPTPRVLPFPECPLAAENVADLTGILADDMGRSVRKILSGTRSCTHLNDLLRTLSDVRSLARHVPPT